MKLRIILIFSFIASMAYGNNGGKEHNLIFLFKKDLNRVDTTVIDLVHKLNALSTKDTFPSVSELLLDNYDLFHTGSNEAYYNFYLAACYTKARNHQQAKNLLQKESNELLLPYVLEQFGVIYTQKGDLDLALKYFLLQADNTKSDLMKGRAYRNAALCYKQKFQLDSAVMYLQKSSALFVPNYSSFADLNLLSIAQINRERGFNLEAKNQLLEVLKSSLHLKNNRTIYETIIQLIETHEDLYEFDSIPQYIDVIKGMERPRTDEFNLTFLRYEMVYSPVDYTQKKEKLIHYKNALKLASDRHARSLLELSESLKLHDALNQAKVFEKNATEVSPYSQSLLKKWVIGLSIVFTLGFLSIYLYNRNNISKRIKALQKERQELHKRIDRQNRELTDLAINLKRKRQFNEEFLKKVEYVKNSTFSHKEQITKLSQELKNQVGQGGTHEILQENINELNFRFDEVLSEKHPNLTSYDKELCGLIRLNFSNKEIANLKNISTQSARTAKYRLKQKLELDTEIDLVEYLQKI